MSDLMKKKIYEEKYNDLLNLDKVNDSEYINFFIDHEKARTKMLAMNFYNSYKKINIINYNEFDIASLNFPLSIMYSKNIVEKILPDYFGSKYNYLYLDNGYLNTSTNEIKFRIILNNMHCTIETDFENPNLSNFKMDDWRVKINNDLNILLCPPTGSFLKFYGIQNNWTEKTIRKIRKNTNRNILIRFKNYDFIEHNEDNYNEILRLSKKYKNVFFEKNISEIDLNEIFKTTYAVVAPSSGVAVLAAIKGIPVFSEKFSPVALICNNDYEDINNPFFPSRDAWINSILNHEFSMKEIAEGHALKVLKKIYKKKLKNIEIAI